MVYGNFCRCVRLLFPRRNSSFSKVIVGESTPRKSRRKEKCSDVNSTVYEEDVKGVNEARSVFIGNTFDSFSVPVGWREIISKWWSHKLSHSEHSASAQSSRSRLRNTWSPTTAQVIFNSETIEAEKGNFTVKLWDYKNKSSTWNMF